MDRYSLTLYVLSHIMKLLEIVRADTTSQETVDAIVVFGEKMGKDPIVERSQGCAKDPGSRPQEGASGRARPTGRRPYWKLILHL